MYQKFIYDNSKSMTSVDSIAFTINDADTFSLPCIDSTLLLFLPLSTYIVLCSIQSCMPCELDRVGVMSNVVNTACLE